MAIKPINDRAMIIFKSKGKKKQIFCQSGHNSRSFANLDTARHPIRKEIKGAPLLTYSP